MADLIPLLNNKKIFATLDGSISCYNITYGEAYHAKSVGAFSESLYKYVKASNIVSKLQKNDIKLLDIGFGLGYNLAVTIEKTLDCKNKLKIISLEKDPHMIEIVMSLEILWPIKGYKILRELIKKGVYKNYSLEIILGDATHYLNRTNDKFDIIFFDPFSKSKNEEMWSKKTITNLYKVLKDDGIIVTYACSKKIRKQFSEVGFKFQEMTDLPKEFQKGTIFIKAG